MNLAHEPIEHYPAKVIRYQNRQQFRELSYELRSKFTLLRQMDVADSGLFAPLWYAIFAARFRHATTPGELPRGAKLGRDSGAHF